MKRTSKRLISVVLALLMVLSMCVPAIAVDGTITTIAALQTAASAAPDSTITVDSLLTVEDGEEVVLDLNGCTVNLLGIVNQGTLTVTNGKLVGTSSGYSTIESTGTLTLNVDVVGARHAVRIEGGTATINGGTYSVSGTKGMTTHAINAGEEGEEVNVIINDGVFNGAEGTVSDSGAAVNVKEGANVTINGGTFQNGMNGLNNLIAADADSTLTVMGGSFDEDVSAYVAEGYKYVDGKVVSTAVAAIGDAKYETLQAAIDAAQAGETVTVIADAADEQVTVDKSLTITADAANMPVLNNVSITINGTDVALTVENLKFTGTSYINANNGAALTVHNVEANVTLNKADAVTNSRAAFISLGAAELNDQPLVLTVTGNTIVVTGDNYPDPVLGWRYIADDSDISGNTFGSETAPNWDAVKLMNVMDGATITMNNNTVYANGNGFAFGQNNSRANAYTVIVDSNAFYGDADNIWVEVSGATTTNATIQATGANTVNGELLTVADIKTSVATWTSYAGVDVVTDADGKVIGGTLASFSNPDVIADGYEMDANGVVSKIGLSGEGTAEAPFVITCLEDLEWFRDDVNAGNDYYKKVVKLDADIDLANAEWTPIGYMGATFKGTFDGGDHTISNLTITKTTDNTAANNSIGFFGRTDSPAVIENLTIENVDITGSLYVGAVVGFGYTGSKIENVTVKGDIAIDAWWYAGGIGGNGYMNLVNNCHVIGNDGSYIKGVDGSYIGGIWGFRGEGGHKITNCTVENIDISGVDRVGAISGILHYGNTIADCTATDVTVTATDADATTVGLIAGACQGTADSIGTLSNNTLTNVTATAGDKAVTALYGTTKDGTVGVTNLVAQVGTNGYKTLAEAVAAAKDGETVEILASGTYTLPAISGKALTIQAADVVDANIDMSKAVNMSGSDLTFKGLTFTYASNSTYKGLQHINTATYEGCTINGQMFTYGNVETFTDCTFVTTDPAYYNLWTYGAKEVELTGCTFNCAGKSVLVYNEGATGTALTVTDCDFIASQSVEGKAAIEIDSSLLNVEENEKHVIKVDAATTVNGFATGSISGSTLWNEKMSVEDRAEVYVAEAQVWPIFVAQIGDNQYSSIKAAVDAAKDGDTITLLTNVESDETVLVDKDVTIDLNGKTVTSTAVPAFLRVLADVTVKNGTVRNDTHYAFIVGSSDGTVDGTLTIESGSYYGTTSVASVTKGALYVKGGNFAAAPYEGSYTYLLNCIDANYKAGEAEIVVTGGTFAHYNPANNAAEGAGTNFVAEGYKAVDNGDDTWTVEAEVLYVAQNVGTGEKYTTVQEALNDANSDETVQMLADSTEDTVMVPNGVTLDLNGWYLTSKYFLSFGQVSDTAEVVGGIVISNDPTQAHTFLQANNTYLPIYDTASGCYRFFAYELDVMGVYEDPNDTTYAQFGYKILFTNPAAYELLATTTASEINLVVDVSWDTADSPLQYTFKDSVIKQYAEGFVAGKTMILELTLSGLDALEGGTEVSTTASVKSSTGVLTTGETVTCTVK